MDSKKIPRVVLIVGKSNSGKTTLMENMIRELSARGFRVGSVKHAHDTFDFDKQGKDSWRHKNAGAVASLIVTDTKVALVKEDIRPPEEKFFHYLGDMDLILVEGFKTFCLPKIEVFRKESPHEAPLYLEDPNLVAFVTDTDIRPGEKPCFGLEDVGSLADLVEQHFLGSISGRECNG
ncbi:molybdopterin-guanine dinucleotide biosynthesis protein B [Desulfobacter hydrogenophilus]|uniref:Molybdopterin-guanine dinucleotide biosynthesis protein B n=1 Tax=Desulfobacter hydrogenophilus TaxID=2291 RepID=A0A328FEZ7_9BACT|nr:molybdopterin-guanine dinucleotide biosynthesis protein B [Desulfobacter hydrogenophilus]NDY73210.1 molybdopterin-guanine dinucleotide biosynthesis protein B [Desulfobacter hydrogenophilus]QBH12526.1 molybdopterin-guanine dinucleotide biosynthesis protein B [Desulfobacter hydrogenophilus]RAM03261.1 molybdopterin-guanine dinucleotide biosynthesis protein B [Desulfobacter hydrogenophilus]